MERPDNDALLATSDEVHSERDRLYIERYTKKTRQRERTSETLWHRIRWRIEWVNRWFVYGMFHIIFHNEPFQMRLKPSEVRSIFVIPFGGAIGDMLVALPLFHAIKRHLPDCKVGTFVTERNRSLIRSDPNVDEAYYIGDKRSIKGMREIFRARRSGYDVIINMHIHGMTEYGLIANVIAPRGVKVSWTHARGKLYQTLYNKLIPFGRNSMQEAQMGLLMLESVIELDQPLQQWESRPSIVIAPDTQTLLRERIDRTLTQLGASWYILLNLQARNPRMEWGLKNAGELIRRFVDAYPDGAVLLSASPIMREVIERQLRELQLSRAMLFPTSFDLHEIAMLVAGSRLVITPDTAITHFASASERPVLVLHPGIEHLPLEWIALQVPSYILAPAAPEMSTAEIPVSDVWEASRRLLEGEWTSTASSIGLQPDSDPLFQHASGSEQLTQILQRSCVSQPIDANKTRVC